MSSDLLNAFGTGEQRAWTHTDSQDTKPKPSEDDEDDDFGDFEEAEDRERNADITSSIELLSLSEEPGAPFGPSLVESAISNATDPITHETFSVQEAKLSPQFSKHMQIASATAHQEQPSASAQENEWGDFVDQEFMFDADQFDQKPEPETKPKPMLKSKPTKSSAVKEFTFDADEDWDPVDVPQAPIIPTQPDLTSVDVKPPQETNGRPAELIARPKDPGPAPTNIPPPSVLLFSVTKIFQTLSTDTRNIVTLDHASSDPFEAVDEPRIEKLQRRISMLRASARIIAGRKLRWKRDIVLSQSMKIGAAGQSGMKLSSVDKNETRRENQEVAEAVHIWKKQIGPLRSTVAKVNIQMSGEGLAMPDISEIIPVRQGKPGEGAVKAPKCCFLCGVNRDERVAKVDLYVEDSFGEWWVEHWGHVDCVTFWEEVRSNLPQR